MLFPKIFWDISLAPKLIHNNSAAVDYKKSLLHLPYRGYAVRGSISVKYLYPAVISANLSSNHVFIICVKIEYCTRVQTAKVSEVDLESFTIDSI